MLTLYEFKTQVWFDILKTMIQKDYEMGHAINMANLMTDAIDKKFAAFIAYAIQN